MNKTNPIFEALNGLDENYAAEAVTPRKKKIKKPLKIAAIVAAFAAALSMLAGFTYSNGIAKITLRKGENTEYNIEYRLTLQEYTIPEEFSPNDYNYFFGHTDIMPSELFKKFDLTLLTNDNFTDTKSVFRHSTVHGDSNIYSWEPFVAVFPTHIYMDYVLYDKNIDRNVIFGSFYFSDIDTLEKCNKFGFGINKDGVEYEAEVVRLNDGSSCVIMDGCAYFSYNGVRYDMGFDNDGRHSSIEALKQVLADLGIYDPTDK